MTHLVTKRELEVRAELASGAINRLVARALRIDERTAATHVEHLLMKLGAAIGLVRLPRRQ